MSNVILIDHGRIKRDERRSRAPQGSPHLWGALRGSLAILNAKNGESRTEELRELQAEQRRKRLEHAIADMAVNDGPLAMIEFTLPKIKAYRTGSCNNE